MGGDNHFNLTMSSSQASPTPQSEVTHL